MFTGLVQTMGHIQAIHPSTVGLSLVIDPEGWDHRPASGDSIAVNGCCLTVAPADSLSLPGHLRFDVVQETLAKTTLGGLRTGSRVNLEHACRPETLMGGHFMQGHIDGVATVVRAQADPADWRLELEPPRDLMPYIVPKGSIAIEGVSLTIAEVSATAFSVALIPTTLERTTLSALREGHRSNIETDIIAKTIVNYLKLMKTIPDA